MLSLRRSTSGAVLCREGQEMEGTFTERKYLRDRCMREEMELTLGGGGIFNSISIFYRAFRTMNAEVFHKIKSKQT